MAYEYRRDIDPIKISSDKLLSFERGEVVEVEVSARHSLLPSQRIACKCFSLDYTAEVVEMTDHGQYGNFKFRIKKVD